MNFRSIDKWSVVTGFTFQSGDIQIRKNEIISSRHTRHLHSNLVIFKYGDKEYIFKDLILFTFQSGDIQIKARSHSHFAEPRFTFQSGDIQIINGGFGSWITFNLHSNLVIFKCTNPQLTELTAIKFTFQSGDIQISYQI